MRIGIPEALLFQRYEPIIRTFFNNLEVDVVYSGPSNQDILERGIRNCVDEACLPMKLFQGHVSKLSEECDKVVVPRLMKCEFGDSICPKFSGLPELVGKGNYQSRFIFSDPLYLNDRAKLEQAVVKQGKQLEVPKENIRRAFRAAEAAMNIRKAVYRAETDFADAAGMGESEETKNPGERRKSRVALLGHPYNISDSFANRNLINKLKRLEIEVITGEEMQEKDFNKQLTGLMKAPYWMFYRENFGKAGALLESGSIDGILYVSSFCCGTDSVIIEMIKSRIDDFPMLVLKIDEHTAEAGIDTRLEAFSELLERRRYHEAHLS